jgi:hypothetical protein
MQAVNRPPASLTSSRFRPVRQGHRRGDTGYIMTVCAPNANMHIPPTISEWFPALLDGPSPMA